MPPDPPSGADDFRLNAWVDSSIRVEFARPKDEPMLWIPDAVAGAVNGARSGAVSVLDDIGQIDVIEIELP